MTSMDGSNQEYEEVALGESAVRITLVPHGWNNSPCLRIQIRDENGHLRQGPDIPGENCADVIRSMVQLLI